MKRLTFLTITLLCLAWPCAKAANTIQSVSQVASGATISADVDYTITSKTPFVTAGSVDITNTEHAVVIIQKIKPSVVLSTWMDHIYIKGEKAVDGVNCQVRMYSSGTIIFPYGGDDFHPLTCYTEEDFAGDSCTNYSEGHSGGYMKTLTTANLLNKIKSFKLKRGYMVTFALGTAGWGYSRCFIADKEDMEINLPENMSGRVSSYRLFKWFNAQKKGLASNGSAAANAALNTSWCYDWAQGNASLRPDQEWVPNHIYEDYPSSSTCGSVSQSCHMKTNNEPRNTSDDHPQTLATILNNWQNLMRTGMRLCSPSSWDGSDYWNGTGFIKTFLDSIDAKGWRCDIVDVHAYWNSGNFGYLQSRWWPNMKRPIWVSEWIWGASWNSNGAFGSGVSSNDILNTTKSIINTLNSSGAVERYAYWNSESKAHIYENGKLTTLGEYYASVESGLGYNKNYEFIPTVVYYAPENLTGTYTKSRGSFTLTWNDNNGDMLDSMTVECRRPGDLTYKWIGNVALKDKSSSTGASYQFTDYPEPGANYYRIASYGIGKAAKYSNIASVTVSSSNGDETMQYGKIEVSNLNSIAVDFDTTLTTAPLIFTGIYTMKNTTTTPVSIISNASTRGFTYQLMPWAQSGTQTITTAEQVPFLAIPAGNHTYGDVDVEIGTARVKNDTTEVTFNQPFAEGVVPVVIVELRPSLRTNPINVRIWDVTNTGFKATAMYEAGLGKSLTIAQTMNYLACTPGQGKINKDLLISAGIGENIVYGVTYRQEVFRKTNVDGTLPEEADTIFLSNPYMFGALQTYNYPTATVIRRYIDMQTKDEDGNALTYGTRIRRVVDTSAGNYTNNLESGDKFGWICISSNISKEAEDVNGDGQVDTQDALSVYEFMRNSSEVTSDTAEDVNGDGQVDTQDVLDIYEYMRSE